VCIGFLGRFYQTLKANPAAFTPAIVENELILACRDPKGKKNYKRKTYDKCELRYAGLSKLRVAELKSILDSWEEVCKACIEKKDL
ncbi:MANF factor, partial [Polyodon spathula]|nr:MANF factor [Polyodon spathula]